MATKLWQKLQDGSLGTRVLSAYLAVVFMVSIVGPGLAVYASEGDVPSEAPAEVDQEVAPKVVAPVETEPAEKAAPVESPAVDPPAPPIVEPEVLPLGAPQASVPEPSVESPLTALAVMPAASVTPVLSGHHNPPLVAGGVRIENPKTKTYKLSDVEIKDPVPYDFSISLKVFENSTGWYLSFSSNYPISKVVMKGGSGGANIYSYSPAVFADSLLHTPANPNGKWAGVSHVDFYFGPVEAPKTGGVLVHKFLDENRNGEFDEGEKMLEGWTFTLSSLIHLLDSEFELDSGVTGPDGKLLFSGLAPGDYDVTETLEEGWTSTTGLTQNVEVAAGQTAHLWFGNAEEFLPFTELDLAITKAVNVRTVREGQLLTYTLTYWNLGDLPASNYSIVDDYDERYMTVVNASGGTVSGGKITWIFPGPLTKEAGKQTLTYTMRVVNSMPDSRTNIDNVVVISHPLDENLANNRDAERVIFTPEDPFLPFTGGEYLFIILTALITSVAGLALRMKPQAS